MKALVTGASSGIGYEISKYLAKRGYDIIVVSRNRQALENLKNEIKTNVQIACMDLSVVDNCVKLYENFKDENIDVLINNAAIGDSGSIADIQVDRIENVFETNVFSNIKITQIALQKLIKNKNGRIIFLSSLAGRISIPFLGPYCSAKFAIEGFASSLRKEMKQLDDVNIQIGIIEPGAYATGFNKENNEKKYEWMYKDSYFKYKWKDIKSRETKYWNFIESKNFNSIIKQYIKAVENKHVKFRYTAPKIQSFIIQLQRIFGL